MKTITKFGVVSLLILGLTSSASASIDKNLKYGQKDQEVTELQEFLIDGGFLKGTPTNFFGLLTLKAVKTYQKSVDISPTGYVGALTRQKINDSIASDVASSNQAEIQETGTNSVIPKNVTTSNSQGCLNGQAFNSTTGQPCSVTPVSFVDVCKNIEGTQTSVPTGMTLDSTGKCFTLVANVTSANNTETKTCLSGKVVSKNENCTKTCSDGEVVLENLSCRTTSTNINNVTRDTNQNQQNNNTSACIPNWQCNSWNTCTNSQQIRICTDSNNCGISTNKPTVTQTCSVINQQPVEPTLNISFSSLFTGPDSAQLSWNTNIPSTGKVSITLGNESQQLIAVSATQNLHMVNVSNLKQGTEYSYTIEETSGSQVKILTGKLMTKGTAAGTLSTCTVTPNTYENDNQAVNLQSTVTGYFRSSFDLSNDCVITKMTVSDSVSSVSGYVSITQSPNLFKFDRMTGKACLGLTKFDGTGGNGTLSSVWGIGCNVTSPNKWHLNVEVSKDAPVGSKMGICVQSAEDGNGALIKGLPYCTKTWTVGDAPLPFLKHPPLPQGDATNCSNYIDEKTVLDNYWNQIGIYEGSKISDYSSLNRRYTGCPQVVSN